MSDSVQYLGVTTSALVLASDRIQIKLDNVKGYEITNFEYDPATGYSTVTTSEGSHGFSVGYGATISGIGFTCPVSYGATFAISNFTYDSSTGLSTITTSDPAHGLLANNNFKLSGIAFTCPDGIWYHNYCFP